MSPHAAGQGGRITIGLVTEQALCGCCGKAERPDWLHSEPPSDLFPQGRMLCGTCFNFCLFVEHRAAARRR